MLSIIIPTYNRTRSLVRALSSLLAQDVGGEDLEVVVVDTALSQETSQAVADLAGREGANRLRYVGEHEPGLLAGRHRGVIESEGDILAFVDDDIEAAPGWAIAILTGFADAQVHLIGGPCIPRFESEPPRWVDDLWVDVAGGRACTWFSLIDLGPKSFDVDPNLVWGLNLSIRRSTLIEVGGFHPDLYPEQLQRYTGDGETGLTIKVRAAGRRARYCAEARVHHHVGRTRTTVKYLEARAFYAGYARSFTDARARGGPAAPTEHRLRVTAAVHAARAKLWRRLSDKLNNTLLRAEVDGYRSHQSWLRRDAAIREWNQRRDYWDYRVPRGASLGAGNE